VQVNNVQIVTSSLSQGSFRVAVQVQQVKVDCVELDSFAFLVLEAYLEFRVEDFFTVCRCHTNVDLETFAGWDVVFFRAERKVLVLGFQGLENKIHFGALAVSSGFLESHFLSPSCRAQTADIVCDQIARVE